MEGFGMNSLAVCAGARKVVLFILGSFAVFLFTLHASCFTSKLGCACPCIGTGKYSTNAFVDVADSGYNTRAIYAFQSGLQGAYERDKDEMSDGGSSLMKPWYNAKYSDDEVFLPENPKLRQLWTTKEWRSKVSGFCGVFQDLMNRHLLRPCDRALCIGAGHGHEVLALKELGVPNSIGIDLVASPPLVMKGDMHSQPFKKDTFDFEFCRVHDHALFTCRFASEIERTLKPGGVVTIHLMLNKTKEEAAAMSSSSSSSSSSSITDLHSADVLISLFKHFEVVHVGSIDAFGLNTEVTLKKRFHAANTGACLREQGAIKWAASGVE